MLILIAMFVYFAANAQAQEVQLHRLAERLRVADVMVTGRLPLSTSDTLGNAVRLMLHSEQREFPVINVAGGVAGVLTREGIIRGLNAQGPELSVAHAMLADLPATSAARALSEALALVEHGSRPIVVLDGGGRFAGLLTRENLGELLLLANVRSRRNSTPLFESRAAPSG